MTIAFKCPACGERTEVAEQYAGRSGPCATCGTYVTVPALPSFDSAERTGGRRAVGPLIFAAMALLLCVVVVIGIVMSFARPASSDFSVMPQSAEQTTVDQLDQWELVPVDLQAHANNRLAEDFSDSAGINLAELPQGDVQFTVQRQGAADEEIGFHVGPGFIHLSGQKRPQLPKRVDGIPVNRRGHALFFLQGAQFGQPGNVRVGTKVGYYVVHYEDASKEMVPIEYGRDVRDWYDNSRPVTRAFVVWKGQSEASRRSSTPNLRLWLYVRAWENPKPAVKINAVDFVSTNSSEVAPFCLAISVAVEEDERARVFADGRREEIVPVGSTWKWLHPTDGIDPAEQDEDFHATFSTLRFDDTTWKAGSDSAGPGGGFGYGQAGNHPPAGVDIGLPALEERKSAYFRHAFSTRQVYEDLVITLQRDDGVVVYLDGQEVGRDNVGDGAEAYGLHAEQIISGDDEVRVIRLRLAGTLPAGDHVLAISLHNRDGGSSDMRIAEISLHGVPVNDQSPQQDGNAENTGEVLDTTMEEIEPRETESSRQKALAAIERLGGNVKFMDGADESVLSVSLRSTGVTDDELRELAELPEIEALDLSHTQITGEGLEHLKSLGKLKRLFLNDTSTGDAHMAALAGMADLQLLQLAGTQVTDEGVAQLAGLAQLRILTLNGTAVTDAGLEHLESLANLQTLNLYDTPVTQQGVAALSAALPRATISH